MLACLACSATTSAAVDCGRKTDVRAFESLRVGAPMLDGGMASLPAESLRDRGDKSMHADRLATDSRIEPGEALPEERGDERGDAPGERDLERKDRCRSSMSPTCDKVLLLWGVPLRRPLPPGDSGSASKIPDLGLSSSAWSSADASSCDAGGSWGLGVKLGVSSASSAFSWLTMAVASMSVCLSCSSGVLMMVSSIDVLRGPPPSVGVDSRGTPGRPPSEAMV
mmetsp:Transcript_31485/g.99832  ORF Transcript_31485/g.99832 Transcript_31485/m.99832 type:complete len:224 (+) Transcript_31485:1645-2316(+)